MKPQDTSIESAYKFLAEIFEPGGEDLPRGHRVTLWNGSSHRSEHSRGAEEASRVAGSSPWRNVSFFGVCTRSAKALAERAEAYGKKIEGIQGGESELAGMPGVWLDLDVESPGHSKAHLAPSIEHAREVIAEAIPVDPTLMVETGGGLHAYWLFSEGIVEFSEDLEEHSKQRLFELCASFQRMVEDVLRSRGWAHDNTSPLPRVMRLPGFANVKHGAVPRPVTWTSSHRRFAVDELWGYVPSDLELSTSAKKSKGAVEVCDDLLVFDVDEQSSEEAVRAFVVDVCDINDDFRKLWSRRRHDFDSQNQYDQAIANTLIGGGTANQLTVQVMQLHRVDNGVNVEKVHRSDYYERTLRKAYAATEGDRRAQELVSMVEEVESKPERALAIKEGELGRELTEDERAEVVLASGPDEEQREAALAALNEILELPPAKRLVRVSRILHDDVRREEWFLEFASRPREANMLTLDRLETCRAFRQIIQGVVGDLVRPFTTKPGKPRQWGPVFRALMIAAKITEPEQGYAGICGSLIRYVEEEVLTGSRAFHKPRSMRWYSDLLRRRDALLWQSQSKDRCGLLIRATAWREWMAQDPGAPGLTAGERRTMVIRMLDGAEGIEGGRSFRVSACKPDGGRTTVGGYLRVREAFLRAHGATAASEGLLEALWSAKDGDE